MHDALTEVSRGQVIQLIAVVVQIKVNRGVCQSYSVKLIEYMAHLYTIAF